MRKLPLFILLLSISQAQIRAQAVPSHSGLTLLDAIVSTLIHHPLIRSQQAQVQISRGLLLQASGTFDSLVASSFSSDKMSIPLTSFQQEQNAVAGILATGQLTNDSNYGVSVQRSFRNGISINPQFQLSRTTDNLFQAGGANTSALSVSVVFPLMRGRGRAAADAQELASKSEVDATLLDLNQLISQLMANTASDYWSLVAAQKNLVIAQENEDRGKVYLNNVQALVDADHVPRNDLHEVMANLAQRSSTRLAAEQQVLVAQQQLVFDMGTSADHIVTYLPLPADDFPIAENQEQPADTAACMDYYAEEALRRRPDYLASKTRYAENKTLLNAARNRLLPQINLNFSVGYAGLQEGRKFSNFLSSSYLGVPGPNATAGISYSFPASNQLARGSVMQSEGLATQAEMQSQQLARTISSSVLVALRALQNSILRARTASRSVQSFQSALAGEREKYAGGIGSIVNILQIEDRLTTAQSDQVQAEQAYALALTQFRFATGTLVRADQPLQNVPADTFFTLPFSCTN